MDSGTKFILCDYFNSKGKRIERIYICTDEDAKDADIHALERGCFKAEQKLMRATAAAYGVVTNNDEASLALHALINQVVAEEISIYDARDIFYISVNLKKSVPIPEIVPALEHTYGANAASWVRGIFPHLNLGHPRVQ